MDAAQAAVSLTKEMGDSSKTFSFTRGASPAAFRPGPDDPDTPRSSGRRRLDPRRHLSLFWGLV